MRLQNTPEFQALADNKAREDGVFFFADYVGIHDDKLVYQAMHQDSQPRCEGFPTLIFIDAEGNVSESIGMDGLEILNGMRHRDYRRGREIFQGYQHDLKYNWEPAYYEYKYWHEVVDMVEGKGYDHPVNASTVYMFLEAAERLGMLLEFRQMPPVAGMLDGCEYYVALVEKNEYTKEEHHWARGGNTGCLPSRITPSKISYMRENEAFVFGSNIHGNHGAGAAAFAMKRFGAQWGVGEGLCGRSYALPTMEGPENFKKAVERFTTFARENAHITFYVTPVGCGIAGYTPEEVAPFFLNASHLENVMLPLSFWKIIVDLYE